MVRGMFNVPIEERVARLEQSFREGRSEPKDIAETLEQITAQVAKLEVYLSNGNGGMTISVKGKRIKFAGSLSLPWLMGILGGGGGADWGIGHFLGVW